MNILARSSVSLVLVGTLLMAAGVPFGKAPGAFAAPAPPAPAVAPANTPAAPSAATTPRSLPPAAKPSGPRVALLELALDGDGSSPALGMQLQDGFVLGLVRAGVDVIDLADVGKKLAGAPELTGCESSPCLKRAGELLDARFALRVRVALTGNSYKMSARLFSTQGAAPAALPIATLTRSCDVCTVGEAREAMIKLADSMRARIETENATLAPPPAPPPERHPHIVPLSVLGSGVLAVAVGAAVIASAGVQEKGRAAIGGTFLGAGLTTSALGLFMALTVPKDAPPPAKVTYVPGVWLF